MAKDGVISVNRLIAATAAMFALWVAGTPAQAANIITFDDNANSCGGAVICSTNGTTGYLKDGSGEAFDLSKINSWFQIDSDGANHLATQSEAEPDGGAGGFLVVNDTGSTVTSWSITLTDTFTSTTASVGFCSGSSGPICDNFQAGKGAAAPGGASEALSGSDFYQCTNPNEAAGVTPCSSNAGQAAADFEPDLVTYIWSGLDIPADGTFDITFSSWNNDTYTTPAPSVPEPGSIILFASALASFGGLRCWCRRRGA
jgi:hypothetical protein